MIGYLEFLTYAFHWVEYALKTSIEAILNQSLVP